MHNNIIYDIIILNKAFMADEEFIIGHYAMIPAILYLNTRKSYTIGEGGLAPAKSTT